ncbi:MAG TPA: hypothetical protein VFR84_03005 [Candidatus Angelobacter sp.]|nr:hypothetical protein [Candidatus Angelobacter sp.]
MKRLLTLLFAFLISASLSLAAQEPAGKDQSSTDKKVQKAEKKEAKAAQKGKEMSLTGWVRDQGGKTVFENDKDKQSWDISNPDAVKGHEGHHVKVKAKLDEANHSLTVDKLRMMRKSKQSGEEKKGEEPKKY